MCYEKYYSKQRVHLQVLGTSPNKFRQFQFYIAETYALATAVMISNHKWICIFCVAQQANKILAFKRIIQTTMAFHGDVGFGINLNETTVIGMYIMRYRVMA